MSKIDDIIKRNKRKLFILLLILTLALVFFRVFQASHNGMLYKSQDSLKVLKEDLLVKSSIEGRELSEIFIQKTFDFLKEGKQYGHYGMLIILRDISCYSCIKYHFEKIDRLSKKGLPVYTIAGDKFQLVKSYIDRATEVKIDQDLISVGFDYELLILLIDSGGKIIKADSANKYNYDKSRIFYDIASRFVKSRFKN